MNYVDREKYFRVLGSIPSFDIVREKNLQNISWHQITHPIYNTAFGKLVGSIFQQHSMRESIIERVSLYITNEKYIFRRCVVFT